MRKVFDHSKSFTENLHYGAEALLDQYINFIQTGPGQRVDQGKVTAAMYGYLYALGCIGMLECKEDQVTPVRISGRYKAGDHYHAHSDAKICAEYVTRYLRQPDQQTVYYGLCEGLKKLNSAKTKTIMERELGGYMGVIAFKLGVATNDMELVKCAVESVEGVSNQLSKLRLHEELNRGSMLESFREYVSYFKDRGNGGQKAL
jgi:hypothetical protein